MRSAISRRWPAVALTAGYALLALAWMVVQPPFRSPDETHHYVRVLGASGGQLAGRAAPWSDPAATPRQLAAVEQATREFDVPAAMSPRPGRCLPDAEGPADCSTVAVATPVGGYQPLPYLLPAALVRAGHDPESGDRLARLGGLLTWAALLGLAALLLWDRRRGGLSLLGLVVAVTPMAVFLGATLNGSGLEIAAAVVFAAGLLRLARDDRPLPWIFASTAFSGALVALSRSTGPLWIGVDVALLVLLLGLGRAREIAASSRWWAGGSAGVVLVAVALNRIWEAAYGPSVTTSVTPAGEALRDVYRQAGGAMQSAIGWFGALEVKPPAIAYGVWAILVLGLIALAISLATRRERLALTAATVAAVAVPALLVAAVLRHTGFPLQGRHVLPLCVVVPLIAGEVIRSHCTGHRLSLRRAVATMFAAVAAMQALCFYAAARFAAVGPEGPWWFLGEQAWSPPLGWGIWLVVAAAGTVLLALAGLGRAQGGSPPAPSS